MSKVGIFGGTFDPIHLGHLITAQSVKEIRNLDKIIFIPAYISPHKTDAKPSLPEDRLNMIKIAVDNIPFLIIQILRLKKVEYHLQLILSENLKKL
ncbi:MAG: adenylyltransferase/cytidyltransferase family protein [Ignavibacteriaceae bacterium]|nr:adenylyltransferase/cytidyltransferase family protein [Ignavibacteriaceae bacterium]